jgi:uncharacterized protein YecE (DUF72 family)
VADHDVFVYFNNDGNANAVRNARTLRVLLDGRPRDTWAAR